MSNDGRVSRLALTACALGLMAGCSTSGDSTGTSSAAPSVKPSPSAVPSPSPSSTPAPASAELALGKEVPLNFDGVTIRVAAFGFEMPVATDGPQPSDAGGPADYVWAAADVSVCLDDSPEPITVSHLPWTLDYADGSRQEASGTGYSSFPQPEFPFGDNPLAVGRCLRGKITYAVPGDSKPVRITYTRSTPPTEWVVP